MNEGAPLRLLTWNLDLRKDCAGQVGVVARLRPDIAAFQEVNRRSWAALGPLLIEAGYSHTIAGLQILPEGASPLLDRFVGVASRWPFTVLEQPHLPSPENVVGLRVATPPGEVDVIATYIPMNSRGPWAAEGTREGAASWITSLHTPYRVLLGDLNSPRGEADDGAITPFARPGRARSYAAELGLVEGLKGHGMRDAFRFVHGYGPKDCSWMHSRSGRSYGFRIDHIFVSDALTPVACWYEHTAREARLSDHAPMVADVRF